jgi:hypothetical protein
MGLKKYENEIPRQVFGCDDVKSVKRTMVRAMEWPVEMCAA